VAVTADGRRWCLLDASPDIGEQLANTPELHPRDGIRENRIAAVLISHPDIHCIAGLLSLREEPVQLRVYCTKRVKSYLLLENAIFRILGEAPWREVSFDSPEEIIGHDGQGLGLRYTAFSVPSVVCRPFRILPAYEDPNPEDAIGYRIEEIGTGKTVVYIPSIQRLTQEVINRIGDPDCLFIDGWAWSEDEMMALGVLNKTATTIGHMPVGGADGSARALRGLKGRRIYVHINNTNPILRANSEERRAIEALGFEVGFDGMEVVL
jgi:pyrroloquinoline quinone biosynthesis protein B